ncbi:DUF551 domain-containing protein [Escherichia coli O109]|nr:DUF551 domain-containing protein [Escherichia coli O109]EFH8196623.1 DUF551 domain-containing protein [Escherichia coli]EFN9770749.1 DUF551 domain-containing protein [Escherichia coli]EFN9885831.1 DUF551 domain-containing protein [Escherichia coli]EFO0087633.1 DUF551 domain-containing protein [Escherichia coli]
MSAITKKRIELFIKNPLDNGLTRGEQMELARIALASLEAEPVAWKVTFTQIDREYNTFTGMYSDKAEVERWVRLHKACNFRADITPLYTAKPVPVTPDGWISCSERMPSEEDVLVYCSDTKEQMVGFHKGKGLFQFFYMNGVEGVCEPSHWMPLPEPPL